MAKKKISNKEDIGQEIVKTVKKAAAVEPKGVGRNLRVWQFVNLLLLVVFLYGVYRGFRFGWIEEGGGIAIIAGVLVAIVIIKIIIKIVSKIKKK